VSRTPTSLGELIKAAVALNKSEKRRQALQFGALGAVSGPAITALSNIVQKGKPLPEGVKSIPRWLAGSMTAGALFGGAVPLVRHQLERNIQADAGERLRRARQRAERKALAKTAAPAFSGRLGEILNKITSSGTKQQALNVGVGAGLGSVLGPVAASLTGDSASDKDTLKRDMTAGALAGAIGALSASPGGDVLGGVLGGGIVGLFDKESSAGGQDLRLPVMGGTKFPTQDSIRPAKKQLQRSSAEVGPQPASTYSEIGKMKKVAASGDDMDPMLDDPLVLFLKKAAVEETAKEQPPLTGLVEGSKLEDNLGNMPLGEEEQEATSQPPCPTPRMAARGHSQVSATTGELFSNSKTTRKKFEDKDHPFEGFDKGVVDRILGL
jgi:hypothetical protein